MMPDRHLIVLFCQPVARLITVIIPMIKFSAFLAGILAAASTSHAQLVIDDFRTKTNLAGSDPGLIEVQPEVIGVTTVVDNISGPASGTIFDLAGSGTRTVEIDGFATGSDPAGVEATPNRSAVSINFAPANVFRINNDALIESTTSLTYDGFDNFDLTQGGDNFTFTLMNIDVPTNVAPLLDDTLATITVENNGNFYSSSFVLNDIVSEPQVFLIPFSSFNVAADFTAVDSIALSIDTTIGDNEGRDLWMDNFAIVPEPATYAVSIALALSLAIIRRYKL